MALELFKCLKQWTQIDLICIKFSVRNAVFYFTLFANKIIRVSMMKIHIGVYPNNLEGENIPKDIVSHK